MREKKVPSKQQEAEEAVNAASSFSSAVQAGAFAIYVHDDALVRKARGKLNFLALVLTFNHREDNFLFEKIMGRSYYYP